MCVYLRNYRVLFQKYSVSTLNLLEQTQAILPDRTWVRQSFGAIKYLIIYHTKKHQPSGFRGVPNFKIHRHFMLKPLKTFVRGNFSTSVTSIFFKFRNKMGKETYTVTLSS